MTKHLTIRILSVALLVLLFQFANTNAQISHTYLYCKAVLLEKQYPDSAIQLLDSVLAFNNSAVFCINRKATILLSQKRYKEASVCYKNMELTNLNLAKLGLARCLAAQGYASLALKELDLYFKSGIPLPENKIRFDYYFKGISDSASWVQYWTKDHYTPDQQLAKECLFMYKSGQTNDALDQLNKRLRKSKTPELYYARGFIYNEMKLYTPAATDYRIAVKANSHNEKWLSEFAYILFNAEQYEECAKVTRQALNTEPALFDLYRLRAQVLNYLKKGDEAIVDLDFYLSLFPADASTWELKSVILTDQNLLLPALVAINKALNLQADNCNWRYRRSDLYMRTGVLQRALLDLNEVITCQPENAEAWFKRGELYSKLGKKEAACSDWKQAAILGYLEAFKRTEHICNKQ